MKKMFIIAMACYGLNARAQTGDSKNFVYLYSDSVIYARNITLRSDPFGSWQLRADSRRVPSSQVKFFSNRDGFFANTRKLTIAGVNEFSERIAEGKINLYQRTSYDPLFYGHHHEHGHSRQPDLDVRMYYNKGFGDLKKVSYNNLKSDMADHPQSMDLLASYKKNRNTTKLMYTAAGLSIVAGAISYLTSASRMMKTNPSTGSSYDPSFTLSFISLGLAVGFSAGGYVVSASGSRHLENAVDAYNR